MYRRPPRRCGGGGEQTIPSKDMLSQGRARLAREHASSWSEGDAAGHRKAFMETLLEGRAVLPAAGIAELSVGKFADKHPVSRPFRWRVAETLEPLLVASPGQSGWLAACSGRIQCACRGYDHIYMTLCGRIGSRKHALRQKR